MHSMRCGPLLPTWRGLSVVTIVSRAKRLNRSRCSLLSVSVPRPQLNNDAVQGCGYCKTLASRLTLQDRLRGRAARCKTAEVIETPFTADSCGPKQLCSRWWSRSPPTRRGNFMGCRLQSNPGKCKGGCSYEGGCAATMRPVTELL